MSMPVRRSADEAGEGMSQPSEAKRRRLTSKYALRAARFDRKVVLITGAAGNFGSVCAAMVAAEGAAVALVDVYEDKVRQVAEEVRTTYSTKAEAYVLDVTKEHDVVRLVEKVQQDFGRIDCLFNSAGYQGLFSPVDTYSCDDFEKVMRINVTGVFAVLKHVSQVMVKQRSGTVVNMASCAGLGAPTSMPAYGSSKAAVMHLTKIAALDLAPSKVRVNSVSPAFIGPEDGYMWQRQVELQARSSPTGAPGFYYGDTPERVREQMLSSVPLRRLGTPEEVVQTVMFLLSEESSYITGTDINVSGGQVLGGCRG